MVYEYGMSEEVGFVRIDRRRPLAADLATRCQGAVAAILDQQAKRARELLAEHRDTLEKISAALIDRNRLTKAELIELLQPEERAVLEASDAARPE